MAKSSKYWDRRALRRLTEAEKISEQHITQIKKIYEQAYRDVSREIQRTYRAYSKNTGIDVDKLKELLTVKETDKVWKTLKRQGLDQYIKDNYKSRISRLEQIQAQIYGKAKLIYPKEELEQTMAYKGVINDSYYKAIYDTQKGLGYDFSFNKIDNNMISRLLNEKWSGLNYSQRIWKNTDYLAEALSYTIGGAMLSGQSIEKTTKQIKERFNVSKYYAERLVRTETNHFNNEADAMAYESMDIKKYVFVATLDSRTSEICQNHDNKVYNFKDRETGVNYPPLHPNCRSKTRGYISEEVERTLKRRARNPQTGKTEVIDNISYKDWAKKNGIVTESMDTLLTQKEKQAFTNYTGFDATRINTSLRKGDIKPSIQEKIDILDGAFSKALPLKKSITVHRGALHSNFNVFENKGYKITDNEMLSLKNQIITDKAFVSTSREKAESRGRNVIMKIKLPKGFKGAIDIENYALPKFKYQKEVLLKRNCNFYIKDVIIKDNIYYLDVEVVE